MSGDDVSSMKYRRIVSERACIAYWHLSVWASCFSSSDQRLQAYAAHTLSKYGVSSVAYPMQLAGTTLICRLPFVSIGGGFKEAR